MKIKVGLHKQCNKFPHILWRYAIPKLLNNRTREDGRVAPYIYKWLWFYIFIAPSMIDGEEE